MLNDNIENQNKESIILRWSFRFGSLILILFFCYFIIRLEFRELAKNENARGYAETTIKDIRISLESLQDAWKTMYYFYQTGDLMTIIKCPTTSKTNNVNQNDTLLMMYREDVETQKTINRSSNVDFNDIEYIKCGGHLTINIGLKSDIHKLPMNSKEYTFKLGEEPLELLEKYPFVKDALRRLNFGEKATFVALPAEKKIFKPKKQTIYEISIPRLLSTEIINLPLYMPLYKNNDKFEVDNHVTCGSVVYFMFNVKSIDGKQIASSNGIEKVKIGSGMLNEYIEQIMTQMQVGDRYKILLTKKIFQQTELLNKNLFDKDDILIFDLIVTNVQK